MRCFSSCRYPALASVLAITFLAALASATPASFSQNLAFSTGSPSPSLWGPGKNSNSFGVNGGAGISRVSGPFDVQITPGIGGSYDFSASSGSASASVNGTLAASYDDHLSAPGNASISLDFNTSSGNFSTDLGARAELKGYVDHIPFGSRWDFCFYCKNWSLQTGSSLRPDFGVTRSGSDSVSVAGVGPDFGVIASATANLNATQTSNFRLDDLSGLLTFRNQDTGTQGVMALTLSGASVLDVALPEAGTWDFGFTSLDLGNTFWSTMGASLSLDIDVFSIIDKKWTFAGLELLKTGGFELDFAKKSIATAFSITVPEPMGGSMLALGLLGLARVGSTARRQA